MTSKRLSVTQPTRPPKIKRSYYLDVALWERLQAFARSQEPAVTDTAVVETAIRHFLDAREKQKK